VVVAIYGAATAELVSVVVVGAGAGAEAPV
jgi:hypothetical protein